MTFMEKYEMLADTVNIVATYDNKAFLYIDRQGEQYIDYKKQGKWLTQPCKSYDAFVGFCLRAF